MEPFDHWWALYLKHSARTPDKRTARKKFNAYDLATQRIIFKDTVDRIKHYPDWQEEDGTKARKRIYMNAPCVYLNQKMWETPVEKSKLINYVRDTCNETVNPAQEIQGLRKLIEIIKMAGVGELAPLEAQLKKRLEKV